METEKVSKVPRAAAGWSVTEVANLEVANEAAVTVTAVVA